MDFKKRYIYNPITDLLGKGGFARVYRANDTLLNRVVALKFFIHPSDDKHTLIQEISRAIALNHENLCRYYDAALICSVNLHGEKENTEVGVIEYIDGGELKFFAEQNPELLDKLLVDVLRGLSFLHNKGIIHRDLKPQNILIKTINETAPVAKITDFGISKDINNTAQSTQLMGSIEYMAPEQFDSVKYGIAGKISTNLDLWSFGVMAYELISGEKLFGSRNEKTSEGQIMGNILDERLVQDKLNRLAEPYQTLIKKCLVKDAKLRVQKADELIGVLLNVEEPNKPQPVEAGDTMPQVIKQVDTKPGNRQKDVKPKTVNEDIEAIITGPRKISGPEIVDRPKTIEPEKPGVYGRKKSKAVPVIITVIILFALAAGGFFWYSNLASNKTGLKKSNASRSNNKPVAKRKENPVKPHASDTIATPPMGKKHRHNNHIIPPIPPPSDKDAQTRTNQKI